jgi:hypothetical protein
MTSMTSIKGKAEAMEAVCRAPRPPATSRTAATPPSKIPQAAFKLRVGSWLPPEVSMATTKVPESAEVIKKAAIKMIARKEVIVLKGKLPRVTNRALAIFSDTAALIPATPIISKFKAVPPKIASQIKLNAVGATRAPIINSRTVRPREMRAINWPTKGPQAIHQAQ